MTALRAISLTLLLVCASCTTTINAYCKLVEPIRYSKKDTKETVRQIVGHNAVWKSQNCPAKE